MYAAGQAAEISRSMLTYLGQVPGARARQDCSLICRQALPVLASDMPKNIAVASDLPDPGPVVSADATQIQQVLANLLTNAWEACGADGGSVRLIVRTVPAAEIPAAGRMPADWQPQAQSYACLEVADTGGGIAGKDLEKIFDPFFTTKFLGRGMGLSVVVGILRAHDGCLTVENKPGRGCIFRAYLPVAEHAERLPPVLATPAGNPAFGGTLLVIEDDQPVREVAARMIECCGFKVLTARDGVEGLEVFQLHDADIRCVLCDLTMPRMGGWETLAGLRSLRPGLPVILASGYDEAQVMAGDHPERPQIFLGKPYQMQSLRAAIGKAIGA